MNKTTFIEWVDAQKKTSEALDVSYAAGIDLINFSEVFMTPNHILKNEIFTAGDIDWIDWFMYERDESSLEPQAWDKDDNPVCGDIDGLWDLLVLKVEKEIGSPSPQINGSQEKSEALLELLKSAYETSTHKKWKKIQIKKSGKWLDMHPEGQEVPAYRFETIEEANEMLDTFYPELVEKNKLKEIIKVVDD